MPIFTIAYPNETADEFKTGDQLRYISLTTLSTIARNRDIDLRWVFKGDELNQGAFQSYWTIEDEIMTHHNEPYRPDLLYVRPTLDTYINIPKVNTFFLRQVCDDKIKTYETFPECVKKTILVTPETADAVLRMSTDLVVVKPRYGSLGRDVQILPKSSITKEFIETFQEDFVAQELIDSSAGMGAVVSRRHELRVYIFNGKITSPYLRIPKEGSYLANISQGAKEKMIEVGDIPKAGFDVIRKVDSLFTDIFPRMYCIDIMFENGKPWVVELNSNPGFPDASLTDFTLRWHNALLDMFQEALK